MLRAIEFTMGSPSETSPVIKLRDIVIIVDLDTNENYDYFLNQVKDLGMTKFNYHYILATLVLVFFFISKIKN